MIPRLIADICFGLALIVPITLFAGSTYENPLSGALGVTTVDQFILALVDLVFLIGMPIVVIFIIYSGFLFVTAGDNESKIAKARFVFMWTIVGAIVLMGAKALALAIQATVTSLKG